MQITVDRSAGRLVVTTEHGQRSTYALYSREAFEVLSVEWLRVGWSLGYWQTFSWMGRQILQLPDDMLRLQQVLWSVQPDVIVETGIYQGGSAVFFASLCKAIGKGRVISIENELGAEVRGSLASHPLADLIRVIEGNSVDPRVTARVRGLVARRERVLVFLDSCHTRSHVAAELEAYAPLVSIGSYLIVADGSMREFAGVPNGDPSWTEDNPAAAALEFLAAHPEFVAAQPEPFTDTPGFCKALTYFPDGWMMRIR